MIICLYKDLKAYSRCTSFIYLFHRTVSTAIFPTQFSVSPTQKYNNYSKYFKPRITSRIRITTLTGLSSQFRQLTRLTSTTESTSRMGDEIDKYYQAALELTRTAGKLILEKVYLKKNIEVKSSNIDFVTETDQEVEKLLIDGLSKQFSDHKFIGEESVSAGSQCNLTKAPTWIIDPIDGTMNFVHSFPHSCISIALFIDYEPKIAIIYNPLLEQLFTAIKNKGAYLNDKRIHVSKVTDLADALLMIELGTTRDVEKVKVTHENLQNLIPHIHGLRGLGSAALDMAMVALGCAEAYFEFGIHIWDIAAGELMVTEAGGVVIDPSGGPIDRLSRRVLCASTQSIADQLSQKLVQFYPSPRD